MDMRLTKNTVTIKFIRIGRTETGKPWFNHNATLHSEKLLSKKDYQFYVSPTVRKQISIGSIFRNDNPDNKSPYVYGVIIDNFTTRNCKKLHRALDNVIPGVHVRSFLEKEFNFKRHGWVAKHVYQEFRKASHPYWVRKFNK